MPKKLLTMACWLACGFGIAFAVQAANDHNNDDRGRDRRGATEDRRDESRPGSRRTNRDRDRIGRRRSDGNQDGRRADSRERRERGDRDERVARSENRGDRRHRDAGRRELRDRRDGGDRDFRRRQEFAGQPPRGGNNRSRRFGFDGSRDRARPASFGSRHDDGHGQRHFRDHRFVERDSHRFGRDHQRHDRNQLVREHGGHHRDFGPHWHRRAVASHRFAHGGPHGHWRHHQAYHHRQFSAGHFGGRPNVGPFGHRRHYGHPVAFSRHGGFGGAGHRYASGRFGGPSWPEPRFGFPGSRGRGGEVSQNPSGVPRRGLFDRLDLNRDGKFTSDEAKQLFAKTDANNDGAVDRAELFKSLMPQASAASESKSPDRSSAYGSSDPNFPRNRNSDGNHRPGPGLGGSYGPRGGFDPGGFRPGPFGGPGRPWGGRFPNDVSPARMFFERFQIDTKDALTKENIQAPIWERIQKADANNDGRVSFEELESFYKQRQSERPQQSGEPKKADEKPADGKPQEEKPAEKPSVTINQEAGKPADALTALS